MTAVRLPAGSEERARAYLRGEVRPTPARDAATVVLLRDGSSGIEVYLLRRISAMAFAPGMHVFPGGSVDERDAEQPVAWVGPPARHWADELGCAELRARALLCAAVRETFEETGVLLAGRSPTDVVSDTVSPELEDARTRLITGELSLSELLDRQGLLLRTDLLKPWAHWITPEFEPRRYDTWFFVAVLPPGQSSHEIEGEADAFAWVPVPTAIEQHEAGALAMLPPTWWTLREVSQYDRVGDVLEADRRLRALLPRPVDRDGVLTLVVDD